MDGKVELSGYRSYVPAWEDFRGRFEPWVLRQARVDGMVYCLPHRVLADGLSLFRLEEAELAGEAEFSRLCGSHHAIGWCNSQPVCYPLLDVPLPLPTIDDPSRLLQYGWNQAQIDWVLTGGVPRQDVFDRRRASAGRLIVRPDFIGDRDRIRGVWQSLPEKLRPALPIVRPAVVENSGEKWEKLLKKASEFWSEFEKFCGHWQICGMTTWDLPDPEGPKWNATFTPEHVKERGIVQVGTPWHFPLERGDDVGELAFDDHSERSEEQGIADHGNWQTYAQFLPLDHWNRVFSERYAKNQRIKGFRTKLDSVLASLMHISVDRVQRLHKSLKALRVGKIATLRGRR